MKLKLALIAGLASLSLAACGGEDSTNTDVSAEPSAYEIALNDAIAACHVGVAETDGYRDLDGGEMYELAKDVVKANNAAAAEAAAEAGEDTEAEAAEEARPLAARYVIARCARNMTQYANGGDVPAGLEEAAE